MELSKQLGFAAGNHEAFIDDHPEPMTDASNATRKVLNEVANLFDHLIGTGEQRWGDFETERFRGLRLITSSNLVGCSTGRSAGRLPLSICPA
jgi:hypothetical protein